MNDDNSTGGSGGRSTLGAHRRTPAGQLEAAERRRLLTSQLTVEIEGVERPVGQPLPADVADDVLWSEGYLR
jgi:hypothetical protein